MHVKGKSEEKKLRFRLSLSACQEAAESKILLQNAKRALNLNRSIHPEQYPFFRRDPLGRLPILSCMGLNATAPLFFGSHF